ncbi:hypothetical protein HMPREF0063_10782 [Aeromicrobium marinum DSM 15272]|uniref:Uncharacterized protein n=1 Tax=Aeromicrobium marinum DSM 15272 TaxID=585531 RepID=E2S9Z2_9ACTN|nr:hypothetical protein HMPREF0063_10782 [Aeromicrobium marinum DSM 15272]
MSASGSFLALTVAPLPGDHTGAWFRGCSFLAAPQPPRTRDRAFASPSVRGRERSEANLA